MQSILQTASNAIQAQAGRMDSPHKTEDRAYQAVTVAAILLVLGSLWLF
jgi:hypothetical protein